MSAAIVRFGSFLWSEDRGARRAMIVSAAIIFWLAALSMLFPEAAAGALRVWLVSPTFNHCFLILPLALFLVWYRRQQVRAARIEPDWRGLPIILASGLVWKVAVVVNVLEARQFAVLTMLQGALLCTLGGSIYRKALAPFLYLYFLVPSGSYLIPALQSFTARFAVLGLHVLHIPVFSNGAIIEVPAGTFAVAEACAGLRFLVAAVAFGVFFAIITYRSWVKRVLFILMCATVPVIANGFRALGLIAAAEWIGNPTAALADHLIYGWVFFSVVLIALIAVGQLFADGKSGDQQSEAPVPLQFLRQRKTAFLLSVALSLLCAGLAPAAGEWLKSRGVVVPTPRAPPRISRFWVEVPPQTDWKPLVSGASRTFAQSFVRNDRRIDRFVAIYGQSKGSQNIVRSNDRDADEAHWTFAKAGDGVLRIKGADLPVRVSEWSRGAQHRTVWSFYVVDGQMVSGPWTAKWVQLKSYVTGNRCLSAYVALSALHGEEDTAPEMAANAISAMEDFRGYLCGFTRRSQ